MSTRRPKVTLIGGGSVIWGPAIVTDLMRNVGEGTIGLVDVDEDKLEAIHGVAEELAPYFGADVDVEGSTDRRDVLPDSDVVLFMAEQDRIETWERDWEILHEHGLETTLAENRGPGGLSHTLRTVPLALDVAGDIEELCPDAVALSLTNPEDRIAYAVQKYTDVEMYGFCSGLWEFKSHYLGELLDKPGEEIFVRGAGINHCVWTTEIRDQRTGDDLYPRVAEEAKARDDQPFMRYLYETYGLWPYPSDDHVGEYFGYACELCDCDGYDFDGHREHQRESEKRNAALVSGETDPETYVEEVDEWIYHVFGDYPMSRIVSGLQGEETYLPSINLPNEGRIDGLQDEMIVEVPGAATVGGIRGERFGELPDAITDVTRREGTVQMLSAEAAAEGSREKALRALLHDDVVDSVATAEALLDDFLDAHEEYVRSFS